jgi:hypothetical protein
MHAYAWYVWRKEPRSGPSLKVRVGKSETITALSAVNQPTRGLTAETKLFRGRKTSRSAYIALMRSTAAASNWMKPLAPIALHGSPWSAVGQCRGDGAKAAHFVARRSRC